MGRTFTLRLIALAVAVLDEAAARTTLEHADGPAVRLALRVLVPFVRRDLLEMLAREFETSPLLWSHARRFLAG